MKQDGILRTGVIHHAPVGSSGRDESRPYEGLSPRRIETQGAWRKTPPYEDGALLSHGGHTLSTEPTTGSLSE